MHRLILPLVLTLVTTVAQAALKVGFAERDITPEVGMEVPGGYGKAYSSRIHDPCKVRASVFDDSTQSVALVGIDLLFITRSIVQETRAEIQKRCGLKAENILIGASHSHSSGPIGIGEPGDFDDASPLVKELAEKKTIVSNPRYTELLKKQISDAVVSAYEARAEGTVGFGSGREETVAFNRHIHMKSGLAVSHPGKGNPDNVDFAGPVDPEVGVIGYWNPDGKLIGCVVNFSCHATVSGPGISANWIFYMERAIRGFYPDATVVFLQGACGDVTQVNNLDPHENPEGDAWAQFVGGRVGAEAVKVLLGMSQTRVAEAPIEVRTKVWNIARRVPSPERVKAALELAAKDEPTAGPDWVWAKETAMLDALITKRPRVEVEVQAIQIGPVLCVSCPAEYFCQYGLDWKKGSGFPMTFPVELANGCVGYVPTRAAFDPKTGGGYETRLTAYSNLDITAGDQIRDAGLELAHQLQPAPLPARPPAPPYVKGVWGFGNVPPQVH